MVRKSQYQNSYLEHLNVQLRCFFAMILFDEKSYEKNENYLFLQKGYNLYIFLC
jgi:hypothetical protein